MPEVWNMTWVNRVHYEEATHRQEGEEGDVAGFGGRRVGAYGSASLTPSCMSARGTRRREEAMCPGRAERRAEN